MDEIFELSPKEIDLLVSRINDRLLAQSGKKKPNTLDMTSEDNAVKANLLFPGLVDMGDG